MKKRAIGVLGFPCKVSRTRTRTRKRTRTRTRTRTRQSRSEHKDGRLRRR